MKYVLYYTTSCSPKRKIVFSDYSSASTCLMELSSKDFFIKGSIEAVLEVCSIQKCSSGDFIFDYYFPTEGISNEH